MLPNLIIPGAPRAGSSSLCRYLEQHPNFYFPKSKEPRYFIADKITELPETDPIKHYLARSSSMSIEAYKQEYESGRGVKIKGDASVQYMYYHKTVIPQLHNILGDPLILIILRNPVERAFSNYLYNRKISDKSFEYELKNEDTYTSQHFNSFLLYFSQGLYYEQVKGYIDNFSRVKVVLLEDIVTKPHETLKDIFVFVDVDPDYTIDASIKHNVSGHVRYEWLDKLLFGEYLTKSVLKKVFIRMLGEHSTNNIKSKIRNLFINKNYSPIIEAATKNDLISRYGTDIQRLQDVIDRDLSAWLI